MSNSVLLFQYWFPLWGHLWGHMDVKVFFFFLFLRSATMILIGMTLKLRVASGTADIFTSWGSHPRAQEGLPEPGMAQCTSLVLLCFCLIIYSLWCSWEGCHVLHFFPECSLSGYSTAILLCRVSLCPVTLLNSLLSSNRLDGGSRLSCF